MWDLARFGLSPGKLKARLLNRDQPRILCFCIPKSGTHLLERALCLHPALYRVVLPTLHRHNVGNYGGVERILSRLRPGQIVISHFSYSEEIEQVVRSTSTKCLLMTRDPRDLILSQYSYLRRRTEHHLYPLFQSLPDRERGLELLIQGDEDRGVQSIGSVLRSFSGWLDSGVWQVRFEDLVGSEGGQSEERQRRSLEELYGHLGMSPDEETLCRISSELFSPASPTFNKGVTGRWREAFDERLMRMFHQHCEDRLLARYGYR